MEQIKKLITVTETPYFENEAKNLITDEEKTDFINYIAENPETGDLIIGTGGLRKIRTGAKNQGKRGGARVVYYYHDDDMPLYLLSIYGKNKKSDLSSDEKKAMKTLVNHLKSIHGK
jgi:hypothetical protein